MSPSAELGVSAGHLVSANGPQRLTAATARRNRPGMRWEERLLDLFEDLEQQAEGLHLADRDLELVDRGRAEYAHVELTARVQASLDEHVRLSVAGVGVLKGRPHRHHSRTPHLGCFFVTADDGKQGIGKCVIDDGIVTGQFRGEKPVGFFGMRVTNDCEKHRIGVFWPIPRRYVL